MFLKKQLDTLITQELENKTEIEEVVLYKLTTPYCKISTVVPPTICFIASGKKVLHFGDEKIEYDENNYLLGSANIPIESELENASKENPYVGIVIYINQSIISELFAEISNEMSLNKKVSKFIDTAPVTPKIEDTLSRLLEAANDPLKAKLFGKALLKEFYFYILQNENGHLLYNCIKEHKNAHKVIPVIQYLEKNFKEDININELSKLINSSASSLHEHFKKATTLSPIQFVKKLRLDNAYKLLFAGKSSGEAAFESGFNSQAQFSKEFKKFYGMTPREVRKS